MAVEATLEAARAMETGPGTEPCYREFLRMSLLGNRVNRGHPRHICAIWHFSHRRQIANVRVWGLGALCVPLPSYK